MPGSLRQQLFGWVVWVMEQITDLFVFSSGLAKGD